MKTLEAFWRWVDNEKPGTFTIIQKACGKKALTPLARTALDCAADVVWEMYESGPVGYSIRTALDFHRDDLRDVSLALLPALEKLLERRAMSREVPPQPVITTVGKGTVSLQCVGCGLQHGAKFPDEPTVMFRSDGKVRCNDCARKAEPAPAPVSVMCSCRLIYNRCLTRCPRCNRGTYLNDANAANAALVYCETYLTVS